MIRVQGITDVGLVRKENQDAYAVREETGSGSGYTICVVCDGMGGAAGGKLEELLEKQTDYMWEEYDGMGTTLVSAVVYEGGAVITNVGDSRAYHIANGEITRVTRDHSLVQSMVERGDITAEEARRHPNRNLITRALGPDIDAECDWYICPLAAGEFLLLCSDGLVNTVTDQEMLSEILRGQGLEQSLERLLEISKEHGAPDNVTAVLLQVL